MERYLNYEAFKRLQSERPSESELAKDVADIKQMVLDIAQKLTYIAANFHKIQLKRGYKMDEMLQFLEYIRDKYSDVLEVEDLDYIDSLIGEDIVAEDFTEDRLPDEIEEDIDEEEE